jgi:hypothetical protein
LKKGGIKVHGLIDAFSGLAEFVRMTEAKEYDRNFPYHLKVPAESWLVFDRANNSYEQFYKWTSQTESFMSAALHGCEPNTILFR